MAELINICGTPIQLSKIKDFRLTKRECIFYPAYQETEEQTSSVFAKFGAAKKKKFKFVKMVPFGVLLTEREVPSGISHEIKDFGEEIKTNILGKIAHAFGKPVGDAATVAVDLVGLDTSGNREYRVLTQGRRVLNVKLRDIPAKVRFLSGKVSDVFLNDSIYKFLGEPISPAIIPIDTLIIMVERVAHVFFGDGFDLEDVQAVYQSLFESYERFKSEKKNAGIHAAMPKLNVQLPKLNMPPVKITIPFARAKGENNNPTAMQAAEACQETHAEEVVCENENE